MRAENVEYVPLFTCEARTSTRTSASMLHVALLTALAAVPADEVKALPGFAGALL